MLSFEIYKENNLNASISSKKPSNKKPQGDTDKLNDNENIPTLLCAPFQITLWMEFGNVPVGTKQKKIFRLKNESKKDVTISIEKWEQTSAVKAGFNISLSDDSPHFVAIKSGQFVISSITWIPQTDQTVNELVLLKLNEKLSLQINVQGIAGTGNSKENLSGKDRKRSLSSDSRGRKQKISNMVKTRSFSNENLNDRSVCIKTAKLLKSKKPKANSSKLVTMKKIMSDSKWVDKQISSFSEWLNYTFHESQPVVSNEGTSDILEENPIASNNDFEVMNFILRKRREAEVRKLAINNYETLKGSLVSVNHEISHGRIAMRTDRDVIVDLGMQETFFTLLFSYEVSWLRLGLEVVFGEVISIGNAKFSENENLQWKKTLKKFILENFISNSETSNSKKKRGGLNINEDSWRTEMHKHILRKIFSLIFVLDYCKTKQIMDVPILFEKTSEVKSSKEFLITFCKEFLRGEGDIMRHLSTMQYNVSFSQSYVDEFDYTVKNLAVDLRDGVRIARLIELLTKKFDLSNLLRVPAVSRLQKFHNVGLSFKFLKELGIETNCTAKHVVDGDRDKTLQFLWSIMFYFDLRKLIDMRTIDQEIKRIKNNRQFLNFSDEEFDDLAVLNPKRFSPNVVDSDSQSLIGDLNEENQVNKLIKLLISWCNSISEPFGVPVYDLTTSIADGRALCLLIHHYHPSLVPLNLIKKTSKNFIDCLSCSTQLDNYIESSISVPKNEMKSAINNERKNFSLIKTACLKIGGIPNILSNYDTQNLPEEKTIVAFLGHLFPRMVETSKEIKAAFKIQRFFKSILFSKGFYLQKNVTIKVKTSKNANKVKYSGVGNCDVSISIKMSKQNAAQIIANKIFSYQTRCQFLNFLKSKTDIDRNEKELLKVKEDAFIVRISKYGIPKSSFSSIPLTDFNIRNNEPIGLDTPSTSYSETDMSSYTCSADTVDRRNSDLFSEVSDRTNLTNEFLIDDKVSFLIEIAKKDAEKEAEARVEAMIKKVEETAQKEIEFVKAKAMEETILIVEENSQKLLNQLLSTEASFAEKEKIVLLEVEQAKLRALEIQRLSDIETIREKNEKLELQNKLEEEANARKAIENKLAEIESANLQAIDQIRNEAVIRLDKEILVANELITKEKEILKAFEKELEVAAEQERLKSQTAIEIEIKARQEAEEKANKEYEARVLLEEKLRAIEEAQAAEELAFQRAEERQRLCQNASLKIKCFFKRLLFKKRCEHRHNIKTMREIERLEILKQAEIERQEIEALNIKISKCSKLQTFFRMFLGRQKFILKMKSLKIIQQWCNRILSKKRYDLAIKQLTKVQAIFRMKVQVKKYINFKGKILTVQKMYRFYVSKKIAAIEAKGMAALKNMREIEQKEHKASSCLSKFMKWASYKRKKDKSASVLGRWVRAYRPLIRARKLVKGFKRLQAVYKSKQVRSQSSEEIKKILKNLKELSNSNNFRPELTLGNRTLKALKIIKSSRNTPELLKACQVLELSVRLSIKCAKAFAEASASKILFSLIQSCSRSTEHQELLRYSLVILLHVARYLELAPIVAKADNSTDVVIHLMQMFRDKGQILCLSIELLCRLVEASESIKISCNRTESRKCIDGIMHIIETKNRLNMKVQSMVSRKATIKDTACGSPKMKAKYLAFEEPVNCMRHLIYLLDSNQTNY